MPATSRAHAEVPILPSRLPGEIPLKPPTSERSYHRRSSDGLAPLANLATTSLLRNLTGLSAELDAVLESARARLSEGERTRLADSTHDVRRIHAISCSLQKAIQITHACSWSLVDCDHLLTDLSGELQDMLLETGGHLMWQRLPKVRAIEPALGFILRELVVNALHYRSADAPEIMVRADRTSQGWLFGVDDNGIGISPQHWDRVFDPLFTVDPRAWRPGLGLAVSRLAIELMGGDIRVQHSPRHGCLFTFFLPDSSASC